MLSILGKFLLILCFFVSMCEKVYAERPPIEIFGTLPIVKSIKISPNGETFAVLANFGKRSRLAIYDSEFKAIKTFNTSKSDIDNVEFIDNEYIIFTVSVPRLLTSGRTIYERYGHVINVKTDVRPIKLLTEFDQLFPGRFEINQSIGRSKTSNHIIVPRFVGSIGNALYNLVEVNLANGRGKVSLEAGRDTFGWYFDSNGRPLVEVMYNVPNKLYSLRQYIDGTTKEFFRMENVEGPLLISGVMPDGSGVVISRYNSRSEELLKIGFDGQISEPIFKIVDSQIEKVFTTLNHEILGFQISGEHPSYLFFEKDLRESLEWMKNEFPDASIYLKGWSEDRTKLVYRIFASGLGDTWVLQNRNKNTAKILISNRPGLEPGMVSNVYAIKFESRDGISIPAILTLPVGHEISGSPERPLVVLPHSDPEGYDRVDFNWMAQFIASRGYVVLQPNFRGSGGYSRNHQDSGTGEWGLTMQDDITDGVLRMAEADIAGAKDVCIVGASYGAYAALAGGAFTPELYSCVIAIAPITDLPRIVFKRKKNYERDDWVTRYWQPFISDRKEFREEEHELFREVSPLFFAKNFNSPVLLIHSRRDKIVPYVHSVAMMRALRKANKDVTLVQLKGDDHWLRTSDARIRVLREIEKFLDNHMPVE